MTTLATNSFVLKSLVEQSDRFPAHEAQLALFSQPSPTCASTLVEFGQESLVVGHTPPYLLGCIAVIGHSLEQ